ncbi:7459_t:CDS:2, partial [Gigaspora margarita]
MREFIARLWTSNTPEYRKLSKKERDATKSNNDTQITERETMTLSDDEYLDQKHGSELTIERVEGLKLLQAIISDKINKEYSKKVISNNRQEKKMKALKNK